jgi:alpha-L-fucosidase 2
MPDFMLKEMPASCWNEAVPLGNGKIGALIFGGIFREKMVLNHEKLFNCSKAETPGPVYMNMDRIRNLILEGSYKEAEEIYTRSIKEAGTDHLKIDSYQPFAFMFIGQSIKKVFTDYSFKLDFNKAFTEISWKEGEVSLKRSTFISYDKDVICICLEADRKGYINARVKHRRR